MAKRLLIAEKPSVAADLARALGKFTKQKDYYENEEYLITSAIGHLVELGLPEELEKKRGKWTFGNLPVIPENFELKPIPKTEARFKLIKKLIQRKDIDEIINACDAGREGELIFRYILKLAGAKKPVRRLWLQSMTRTAICAAMENLRTDIEMQPLAEAAVCRSESDWLVGINSTRAMTAFNTAQHGGAFQLTPVGRVQTPTLAILVEREEKIRHFKPKTYFEVVADCQIASGIYRARWFNPAFRKAKNQDDDLKAERIWEEELARSIEAKCLGKAGEVTENTKQTSQIAPLLYDLTSLQREANSRFGFSARSTLQIAQSLYERHKVLTYPRTDSRYLPEDYLDTVKTVFSKFNHPELAAFAKKALGQNWVGQNKRVFDNKRVTDHSAIIPTGESLPASLNEAELKIYDMVARRLIAVFYPPARFEVSTRITLVEGESFKTEGKILIDAGWMEVYGKKVGVKAQGKDEIVPWKTGEPAQVKAIEVNQLETKPPPRFAEATLLSAMEGAGKLLDDEELKDAMKEKGLGTPATRAAIIEGLIAEHGYVIRAEKELIPTPKGIALIHLLQSLGIDVLCSPELTGEWEFMLKQMEAGSMSRQEFMQQIQSLTREVVSKAKNFQGGEIAGSYVNLQVPCPKCKSGCIAEDYSFFACKSCDFHVRKILASRHFSPEEVTQLIQDKKIGPLEGFISKRGRPFTASINLDDQFKVAFDFESNGSQEAEAQAALPDIPPLHGCPACKDRQVFETETAYLCSGNFEQPRSCDFRISKTIKKRALESAQVLKLLKDGKTDKLSGFVSKSGRPFSGYLVLNGKSIGFEFPPREKAPAKAETKKAETKKAETKKAETKKQSVRMRMAE